MTSWAEVTVQYYVVRHSKRITEVAVHALFTEALPLS